MTDGSSKYFSYSDFFDPEIGCIHYQSEQAHTTYENRETGRPLQKMGNILLALIEFSDAFIYEYIVKIFFRKILFKRFFDHRDTGFPGTRGLLRLQCDMYVETIVHFRGKCQRLYRSMQRFLVEICQHTY